MKKARQPVPEKKIKDGTLEEEDVALADGAPETFSYSDLDNEEGSSAGEAEEENFDPHMLDDISSDELSEFDEASGEIGTASQEGWVNAVRQRIRRC